MTEFLAIKEFEGKRVDVNNEVDIANTTTETTLSTQTASSGKDMWLAKASFSTLVESAPVGVDFFLDYKLYQNTTVIDTITINAKDLDLPLNVPIVEKFDTKSIRVVTGNIFKITLTHSTSSANSRTQNTSKLILWEEETNKTPQIPSI